MNRQSLPIHEIQSIDRQRLDLGDIDDLAKSISQYGLIQPIVVNQEKRLIAGGRRLAAHIKLGCSHIDVVFRETLTVDELHELELEENVRRKSMQWQEECLNIFKIHQLKYRRSAIEGSKWGMRQTGEMLGIAASRVSYNNEIAVKLTDELTKPIDQRRYWNEASFSDAWKLRLRDEEELLQASLAKDLAIQSQVEVKPPAGLDLELSLDDLIGTKVSESGILAKQEDVLEVNRIALLKQRQYITLSYDEAKELYLAGGLNPPEQFDTYYKSKIEWLRQSDETIYFSKRVHNQSCIDYMLSTPDWFDHIITDPPYGIEMSNLDQQNQGMSDIDTVSSEHDVKSNEDLFTQFFPAAYTTLKANGFLVLWCDIMQWQRLYDLAISAGFKVQRWPITWIKTHRCMNQSANQNFTKTTEIAMVCRKGTATLNTIAGECHILASHDEYKEELGHPFVKPFAVWEYIIDHISYEGQTILEPFAGRGSGYLSIIRKKRLATACELNTQHFNALIENIKQYYLKINPNYKFK